MMDYGFNYLGIPVPDLSLLSKRLGGLPLDADVKRIDAGFGPSFGLLPLPKQGREKKRKTRKAQRQARKRNRK